MKLAREAATLIYSGVEKEYKQAKLKAAKAIGSHFLPTNLEVAIELDRIADEREGSRRLERLIQMRREALKLMQILKTYEPLLIGSVWRGTIHYDSDIDIVVYHDAPEDVLKALIEEGIRMLRTENVVVTKKGKNRGSFHIYAESSTREKMEIKVCTREEMYRRERCEIYGDEVVGLRVAELRRILENNPTQRFTSF
jgi:predicted nucleotidyltransferase